MVDERTDSPDGDGPNRSDSPTEEQSTFSFHAQPGNPERVGPYRILQKIGEGGMGVVYEAEQEEPVHRKVALKLVKWGMDTKTVMARFESERQALALMNHPNIARVFDAGATEQGRPYFAMEYVKGESITSYCDRHRLTTGERLALFMQVCDGVQHAHQKGVIHRDIKPSNVLVAIQDDRPAPKIIDFGVAKATEHRLTEKSVFTEYGQLIGTPEYMSPEQAEMTGLDIDTRTDVYSLGVLLYELLVGVLPFDPTELRKAGFDDIRRRIREEEPTKPSTRIGTLPDASTESARRRRTDPRNLMRVVRGELDWITMKALEKDRTRRYESPSALERDIARYLKKEPVLAGPPGMGYLLRKFVRRNRVAVLSITGVAIAGAVSIFLFADAYRARGRADAAEIEASSTRDEALFAQLRVPMGRARLIELDDESMELFKRFLDRIRTGQATQGDHEGLARGLLVVRREGRLLRKAGSESTAFEVELRHPAALRREDGLAVRIQPRVHLGGSEVSSPSSIMRMGGYSAGGGTAREGPTGFDVPIPDHPGRYTLKGSVDVCFTLPVPEPGPDAVEDAPSPRVECLGPWVKIDVPELSFVAVHEYPEDYPIAIRDPELIDAFVAGTQIDSGVIQRSGDEQTLQFHVNFPATPLVTNLTISLEARAPQTWQVHLANVIVGPVAGSRGLGLIGGGEGRWVFDQDHKRFLSITVPPAVARESTRSADLEFDIHIRAPTELNRRGPWDVFLGIDATWRLPARFE